MHRMHAIDDRIMRKSKRRKLILCAFAFRCVTRNYEYVCNAYMYLNMVDSKSPWSRLVVIAIFRSKHLTLSRHFQYNLFLRNITLFIWWYFFSRSGVWSPLQFDFMHYFVNELLHRIERLSSCEMNVYWMCIFGWRVTCKINWRAISSPIRADDLIYWQVFEFTWNVNSGTIYLASNVPRIYLQSYVMWTYETSEREKKRPKKLRYMVIKELEGEWAEW